MKTSLILFLFYSLLFIQTEARALIPESLCSPANENTDSLESRKIVKKQLDQFANHPLVAKEADQMLSKLISAKSPAIIDWMNQRDFSKKSDTEVAKEWRVYYAEEFTLPKYPVAQNAPLNHLIEKFVETTYSLSLPQKKQEKLKQLFKEAKAQALLTMKHFPLLASDASAVESRIAKIELNFLKQLHGSSFEKNPLEAISWGIAYDPLPNKINIGIEALRYSSDETLFAVFAHEIGHSFDPCRWGAFVKGNDPFTPVVECLRSNKSAEAKPRDDRKLETLKKSGSVSAELYESLKANPTCNQLQYPTNGVQADQIQETFSDWFSAEVIAESKYAKAKVRSDLCVASRLQEGSSYPSNETRLLKIYFAHPKLKALVSDSLPPALYCALPTPSPHN